MKKYLLFFLILVFVFGCASVPLRIENQEPKNKNYEVLGEGVGSATGLMLFQFIPIGQNERFRDAYNHAIKSKSGDDLINVEITETWFWAYILNGYVTTVKGTAIKYKK